MQYVRGCVGSADISVPSLYVYLYPIYVDVLIDNAISACSTYMAMYISSLLYIFTQFQPYTFLTTFSQWACANFGLGEGGSSKQGHITIFHQNVRLCMDILQYSIQKVGTYVFAWTSLCLLSL